MTMRLIVLVVIAMVVMPIISTTGGSTTQEMLLMGTKSEADVEFVNVDVPSPLSSSELIFQVLPSNFNSINFTELAKEQNPLSTNLGPNYLASEVLAMMTPDLVARGNILTWLGTVDEISIVDSSHDFLINAWGPMPKWEEALNCTFSFYENTDRVGPDRRRLIRTNAYYLPKDVASNVLIVYNTVQFPYIATPVVFPSVNATPGGPAPQMLQTPSYKAHQLALGDHSAPDSHNPNLMGPKVRNEQGQIHTDYVPLPKEGYSRVVLLDKEGNLQSVFQMIDGQVVDLPEEEKGVENANKFRKDAINALQTEKAGYLGMDLDAASRARGNGGGKNAGTHWTSLANPENKQGKEKSTVHVTSENTQQVDEEEWSRDFIPYKLFSYLSSKVFGPKLSDENDKDELESIEEQRGRTTGNSLPFKIYVDLNDVIHNWLGVGGV